VDKRIITGERPAEFVARKIIIPVGNWMMVLYAGIILFWIAAFALLAGIVIWYTVFG
jgi:hypothetical protein